MAVRGLTALLAGFCLFAATPAMAAAPVAPKPTPPGTGAPPGDPATACRNLARVDFTRTPDAPAVISSAVVQAANADTPDLCLVSGNIAPTTGYRMWLPLRTWNGKYVQAGCGGRCGDVLSSTCEIVAARGYACLASDLGHKGTQYDVIWAIGNLQGQLDFGFRSTHIANVTGRAITQAFYGAVPRYTYYLGASTGGRQGLIAAQRFPDDFDGVVAGEPALGYIHRLSPMHRPAWPDSANDAVEAMTVDGRNVLTQADALAINARAVAACDMDDGLKDGIISDPLNCAFDPGVMLCRNGATTGCLTQVQVDAVRRVYAAGPLPGSEKAWNGALIGTEATPARYGPTRTPRLTDPYSAWLFNATNPDLAPFKASGGKLIVYQGWADEATFPQNPITYYESVERLMGGRKATQDFFRLFMIPGQSHFPGNGGAENVDYLSYLEAWVERGQAPDVLLAARLKDQKRFAGPVTYADDLGPEKVAFTRPVYPYPVKVRYKGRGDPNDAASFEPDRKP